jgi:hypothetical protein
MPKCIHSIPPITTIPIQFALNQRIASSSVRLP